jgi:hypothetical protein
MPLTGIETVSGRPMYPAVTGYAPGFARLCAIRFKHRRAPVHSDLQPCDFVAPNFQSPPRVDSESKIDRNSGKQGSPEPRSFHA